MKNEFIKYGVNKLLEKLTSFVNEIFNHEQIPQSWLRSMIINIDKGKNNKELLLNKRRITLSNNICKLLERVINNKGDTTIHRSLSRGKRKQLQLTKYSP